MRTKQSIVGRELGQWEELHADQMHLRNTDLLAVLVHL